MPNISNKTTKKDLLKEIGKLKKTEILKIVEEYCPQKGGFLFFEESITNKKNVPSNYGNQKSNERNNNKKKENNRSIRQEIVFDSSKLVKSNQSIMNNNGIYNVIDYE